jgi:AhpC/TSA family protein
MGNHRTSWGAAALLLALLAVAAPAADEHQASKRLQELQQRLTEETRSWLEFRKQAKSEEERAELVAAFPRDEFVEELRSIAGEAKGTEVAARAWMDLFHIGRLLDDRALFAQALERLLADHLASPEMAGLALDLVYGAPPWSAPAAADALRKIVAGTADKGLRAGALAELALLVGLDDSFGAGGRAEAEALLQRIEKEFAGADDFIGMSGKQFATGARHEINELRVGQVAPDFEIADQDGVRFKLSDYRGRVVLLDFWGFV